MSFPAYVKTCKDGIDPQGDFVRDAREDPDLPDARHGESWKRTSGKETRGIPQFAQRKRSGSITWLTGGASLIPREAGGLSLSALARLHPAAGAVRRRAGECGPQRVGCWASALFLGSGLVAATNALTMLAHLAGATAIASAIFLILELSQPYSSISRSAMKSWPTSTKGSSRSGRERLAQMIEAGAPDEDFWCRAERRVREDRPLRASRPSLPAHRRGPSRQGAIAPQARRSDPGARRCNPTATLTMFCSAIYPCQKWSGYASPNTSENVEFFTSPDMATIWGFAAPSRFSAKPYASRVATFASLA